MENKDKIKPAAGSKATSKNVTDRLLSAGKRAASAKNCTVLGSCVDNSHNCPTLRTCTTNAGKCPKLAKRA